MSRAGIEAKLRDLTAELARAKAELAVLDEQVLHFREAADDVRLQAIVDDTRASAAEHREAERHAEAHRRTREKVAASIAELQAARDDLLDRLVLESR
jgi:chromosome segregation ATPase